MSDNPRVAQEITLAVRVNPPRLHEHLAKAVVGLSLPPDAAILDLGCGTGAWLERLAQLGFSKLLGVDADTVQFGARSARVVTCDLEYELPLSARGPFQLITAIEVVEHIANAGTFVRGISSRLCDGGYALVSTPNLHSLTARLRFLWTGRLANFDENGDPSHVVPVVLPAFKRLVEREGLALARVWTFPESGEGKIWRPAARCLARVVRIALRDPLPGDSLCMLLRKNAA